MGKTIGIAGLGWLGKPFAQKLSTMGYRVKGSVTTAQKATTLQASGFDAYPLNITENGVLGSPQGFLKNVEILVIMIPPGLRRHTGADYVLKMSHFLTEIEKANVSKVIFVSSTSVYGSEQGIVTEKIAPKPENEAGKQLFQVEQLFFNMSHIQTSIVRFGGLIGGNRQPVRYLAGRKDLNGGNAPVNMIHRDDCINILTGIIFKDAFGHIFNAVHPSHPLKKDYYLQKANDLQLEPPTFNTQEEQHKQVDSVNLKEVLEYTFQQEI